VHVEAGIEQPELALEVLMHGRGLALQAVPQSSLVEPALGVGHVGIMTQREQLSKVEEIRFEGAARGLPGPVYRDDFGDTGDRGLQRYDV
jgi:hypothetical protein